MTTKDFNELARQLQKGYPHFGREVDTDMASGYRMAVNHVADACCRINPRFDRGHFMEAVYEGTPWTGKDDPPLQVF